VSHAATCEASIVAPAVAQPRITASICLRNTAAELGRRSGSRASKLATIVSKVCGQSGRHSDGAAIGPCSTFWIVNRSVSAANSERPVSSSHSRMPGA
jgi:hypothetical protein